jgi:hypothetical protein
MLDHSTGANRQPDRLELAWDARRLVDLLDDAADNMLKSHGIHSWPRLVEASKAIQQATGRTHLPVYDLPDQTPEQAQAAAQLLEVVRQICSILHGNCSINDAIILGLRLGIAAEGAGLSDLVPLAKRPIRLTQSSEHIQASPERHYNVHFKEGPADSPAGDQESDCISRLLLAKKQALEADKNKQVGK